MYLSQPRPNYLFHFIVWWVSLFFMHLFLRKIVSFCLALEWNNVWVVLVTFLEFNLVTVSSTNYMAHVFCFSLCACSKMTFSSVWNSIWCYSVIDSVCEQKHFFPKLMCNHCQNVPVPFLLTFRARRWQKYPAKCCLIKHFCSWHNKVIISKLPITPFSNLAFILDLGVKN